MEQHVTPRGRIQFIDFTRGIVMILMAWDHVSGFWNPGKLGGEGLGGYFPYYTDLTQFLLRFMTHVCAPTFMFLAGTSLALSIRKRQGRGEDEWDISKRLIGRGAMLLLIAVFLVGPAFGSGPFYVGVIASFGFSFLIFSVYRRVPTKIILTVSLVIILFHQYLKLDFLPNNDLGYFIKVIINTPVSMRVNWPFGGLYPIIPWIGIMGLGWCFGDFLHEYDWKKIEQLKLPLAGTGIASITLFFVVRWFNGYGNLVKRPEGGIIAWLSISKYPPSLAFVLWTLGLMSLIMVVGITLERFSWYGKGLTGAVLLYGKTALFFYSVHLPLYRVRPFWMDRALFEMNLWSTGVFWVIGLGIMWWFGKHFLELKRSHPDSLLQYI